MNFRNHSSMAGHDSVAESSNITFSVTAYQPTRNVWFWVTLGFICVVTTIGNLSVIFLIISKRSFRSKVSPNWFILSLGVSDLLIGTFDIPGLFVCSFTSMCSHTTAYILFCFRGELLAASTTNVCLLTFDIYLAVFHPFSYPNLMSPTKSRMFIILSWIIATIFNIPLFTVVLSPPDGDPSATLADNVMTILFYSLAGVFLTYAFVRIMLVVKSHKKDIEKHQLQIQSNANSRATLTDPVSSTPSAQVRRRNRDGTITATGVVTASFIICSTIWHYKLVARIFHFQPNFVFMDVADIVMYCNCTMNFIVYALLKNDLREELKRYFRKVSKKGNNGDVIRKQMRHDEGNRQTDTLIFQTTKDDLNSNEI